MKLGMFLRIRWTRRPMMAAALVATGLFVSVGVKASAMYSYDLSGRLTTVLYDNGLCVAYGYDANGNRTSQTNAISGGPVWGTGSFGCFSWSP
jgi:YD repeat-containing protein